MGAQIKISVNNIAWLDLNRAEVESDRNDSMTDWQSQMGFSAKLRAGRTVLVVQYDMIRHA